MAHDQHLLWTTRGQKAASKERLDPHSLYDFFSTANTARLQHGRPLQRIKSAVPRIGGKDQDSIVGTSSLGSYVSLRDPSPTPATSRPLSSRSGRSSFSSRSVHKTKPAPSMSPSSLYLGLNKARCKSAPPRPADYYLPQRPKIPKSRVESATSSSRVAAKRAWQNRTSSAKSQHSLLPREEVEKRHKERCKSAPLPYDFSSIEVVTSVPEQGSDIQRLKAFTRPLTCMPDVVQNVLSHSGLRHCCSAYQPKPKTTSSSRQQFWPVARPAVFHRGDVPKYLHFVKPAGYWIKGGEIHPKTASEDNITAIDNQYDVLARSDFPLPGEDDAEETVLYEEQFVLPATPSETSLSDREYGEDDQEETPDQSKDEEKLNEPGEPEEDLHVSTTSDHAGEYLEECEANTGFPVTSDATPEPNKEESSPDETSEPADQGFEVIITKVQHSPVQSPSPDNKEQEPEEKSPNDEQDGDLQIVVPEMPHWAAQNEEVTPVAEENNNVLGKWDAVLQVDQGPGEPGKPVKDEPQKKDIIDKNSEVEEPKLQMNQVKFADSLVLTSYKSPQPKKEKKEQPKKPVSILKPAPSKSESPSHESEMLKVSPVPLKKDTPVEAHKVPHKLPQVKPQSVKPAQEVDEKQEEKGEEKPPEEEAKTAEERTEEPPKLEPEILPKPEYIRAPGAYRMYDPKDLLEYHFEQKRESRLVKKSLTNPTLMPQFKPSSESTAVMTTILDEQKRKKEGMKPWLQGRLALSKQTSRFELPMDVRLLEAMTPMEYLTKYCIISTRRKALYKHIFLKVDKDRDNTITFKEMDRGLKEIHVDSITTEQVKQLIEMVEGNEKSTFNLVQFSAIAAFSERLLFSETPITEKNSIYGSKEIIEEADFCGLKSKLSGFPVNPTVRKILEVL